MTDSEWSAIFAGLSFLISILAAAYAKKSADAARKTLELQADPFVSVEFVSSLKWSSEKQTFKSDDPGGECWLRLFNASGSPIIVEQLYRRWSVMEKKHSYPDPQTYPARYDPDWNTSDGKARKCSMAIAAGHFSPFIRSNIGGVSPRATSSEQVMVFDGLVVYRNISNTKRFVSGFCLVNGSGRIHPTWQQGNPEKYNYRRRLNEAGEPLPGSTCLIKFIHRLTSNLKSLRTYVKKDGET